MSARPTEADTIHDPDRDARVAEILTASSHDPEHVEVCVEDERKNTAAAEAALAVAVSPALRTVIEAHRVAVSAMLLDPDWSDPTTDRHVDVIDAAAAALRAVPSTCLADVSAKLTYLSPGILSETGSVRAADDFRNIREDVERLCAQLGSTHDPIHAVIEAHSAALAHFQDVILRTDRAWISAKDGDAADAAMAAAKAECDAAGDAEITAWNTIFECRPTSIVGLKALIRHVQRRSLEACGTDGALGIEEVLGCIGDAADALLTPSRCGAEAYAGAADHPLLPAPGSDEAKTAFKAACHEHTILTQFANEYLDLKRTPLEWWTAQSLGRALETGELPPAEVARLYPLATERELRMAAIEHRLRLGSLHALAFADTYPVLGETVEAASSAPDHDLSACSLPQLARLYEAWAGIFHHIIGAGAIPCFEDDERHSGYTPAGDILDREYVRADHFLTAIANEARDRQPGTDDDRDERLNVLVRHELECGGRIPNAGVLAEVNAAWGA